MLFRSYYINNWVPTVNMSIDYIRPAKIGDTLLGTATVTSVGKSLVYIQGKLYQLDTNKTVATCSCVFFNKQNQNGVNTNE